MFPIIDARGNNIAFGGRVLVEKRDEAGNVVEAKYLNSPETPVFVKMAKRLYGLDLAKRSIIDTKTAVPGGRLHGCDCMPSGRGDQRRGHAGHGGTTPEHARILRRFCNTVILVFDSDEAGFRALLIGRWRRLCASRST